MVLQSLCKTLIQLRYVVGALPSQNFNIFLPSYRFISITTNFTNRHSFTVSYLINSCGLSPESALQASKFVNFETPEKPDTVLTLFNNHCFSQAHISKIVRGYPAVLICNPESNLLPKLNIFYSIGFSSSELSNYIASNPKILSRSLANKLIPSFDFFKNLLGSDENIRTAIKRFSGLNLNLNNRVAPNIDFLRDNGVPEANIASLLTNQPMVLGGCRDKFERVVEKVKKMDFDPLRWNFLLAVQVLRSMSRLRWEKKMEVYKIWGWSEEQTLQAFKNWPHTMTFSENKITATMEFLVNKMGFESSDIARRPQFISFSLDRRIVPRCSVVQVLKSRGLINKDFSLFSLLETPETIFLQKFVTCYENEAPDLLKLYQEKMGLSE